MEAEMMRPCAFLLSILPLLILFGCETASDPEALRRTWEAGAFAIPASASLDGKACSESMLVWENSCHGKLDRSRKHPVILFMHGCSGGTHQGDVFGEYAVTVSPNSHARPGRVSNCQKDSNKRAIMRLRFAEIRYAMAQLRKLPWVDTEHIYLAGYSEGGAAAALYSGDDKFAGRIIFGWVCTSSGPFWNGIRGPVVPVLAVVGTRDPYHTSADKRGTHCGMHFAGRPHSQSIQIEGAGHAVQLESETVEALERFIRKLNAL